MPAVTGMAPAPAPRYTARTVIGTSVGSFRITSLIAHGGMGTVYRAEHALIGKPAAIKVLQPELSTNRSIVDRFFNEARATSAIKNPGIVEVFDFGYLPSGHAYMVMEFLDGEPLSQYIRRHGRIGEGEAAWIVRSVCSSLAAVHAQGIVHRDLKPDNIFLVPDPEMPTGARTKLLDFGIAKLSGSALAVSQTTTGAVMGTPTYMSPEQCKGSGEVDQRADLYALGCILYEMLSGRPPFTQEGAGEVLGAHLFVDPAPLRQRAPEVSIDLEAVVMSLLAKDPTQRPASAADLAQLLTSAARLSGTFQPPGSPGPARPSGYIPSITPMFTPSAGPAGGPGTGPGPTPASRSSGRLVGPDAATVMADHGRHPTPPPPAARPPGTALMPRATTGTPTTLSGSAGQTAAGRTGAGLAPSASRRWALIGAVAVLFVVAGGGAVVLLGGDPAPASDLPTKATGLPPADEPVADSMPIPDAAPVATAPADAAVVATTLADAAPATTETVLAAGDPPGGDKKPGDKKPGDKKPGDKKPGGKKPGGKKPGDKKPDDKKPDGDGPGPIETDL